MGTKVAAAVVCAAAVAVAALFCITAAAAFGIVVDFVAVLAVVVLITCGAADVTVRWTVRCKMSVCPGVRVGDHA
jgi:hypothetical protein